MHISSTAELESEIPDDVEQKFREVVSKVYGDGEEAFEEACEQAISEWTDKEI